jgi:DNA-binding CsgD family transcriptional regulator/DNA-binding transcriptional regulator YiaG
MTRRTPEQAAALRADEPLTDREQRILELLAGGHTIEAIAGKFGRSLGTVKTQAQSLYKKLGAANAAHAVSIGYQRGLLKLDPSQLTDDPVGRRRAQTKYARTHLATGLARRAREEAGLSAERVAHLCGVPVQAVHYWERTHTPPNTDTALTAYCELLSKMIEAALRPDPLLSLLK